MRNKKEIKNKERKKKERKRAKNEGYG